jgi:hypothetical protein
MGKALKLLVLAFLAPLALGGCETPLPAQKLPTLTYGHLAPFRLDVARIEIVGQYQAPLKTPNVDHLFPTPPAQALRQWAGDRLRPAGKAGTARFVIVDGAAIETSLKRDTGVTGTFKKEQSERYDVRVEVLLEILDEAGKRLGFTTAHRSRSRTVPEDISLADREAGWFTLTEQVMNDLNAALERAIPEHLGGFVL